MKNVIALSAVALSLFAASCTAPTTNADESANADDDSENIGQTSEALVTAAQTMLNTINADRTKAGLYSLTLNASVNTAAQNHSVDMATHKFLSSTGSNGSNPGQRITAAGYKWTAYKEAVARAYTFNDVYPALKSQAVYRDMFLSKTLKVFGFGLANAADGTPYYTFDFATGN